MTDRARCYAWIEGADDLTAPDRSYVINRLVAITDDAPRPESKSWMGVFADEDDGERSAELVFWYGAPANLDREAAEDLSVSVLTEPRVAKRPDLPDGWTRRSGTSKGVRSR